LVVIGTFILDFLTTNFEPDSKVAVAILREIQSACQLQDSFALDEPVPSAGWSFAKLFLSGQLVERIYKSYGFEIDSTKGKRFEDKFIAWFGTKLKHRGCGAQVKMAPEMKSF
jgi:hypothetical protein